MNLTFSDAINADAFAFKVGYGSMRNGWRRCPRFPMGAALAVGRLRTALPRDGGGGAVSDGAAARVLRSLDDQGRWTEEGAGRNSRRQEGSDIRRPLRHLSATQPLSAHGLKIANAAPEARIANFLLTLRRAVMVRFLIVS
jgi:hypothetical protein